MTADKEVWEDKGDCDKVKERVVEDESTGTLEELEKIHAEAEEKVLSEKQALIEDRDQLSSHMDRIGETLFMFMR